MQSNQKFERQGCKNFKFLERISWSVLKWKSAMNKIVKVDGITNLEAQLAEPYKAGGPKLTSGELFQELKSKDLLAPHLACFYVTYGSSKSEETVPVFAEDKDKASILASNKFVDVKRVKSLGEIT